MPSFEDPGCVRLSRVSLVLSLAPVLAHVDLTVMRGETVLIHGPNGAGKSTLLALIATALPPTYGTGTVLGYDIEREREAIRRNVELLEHRTRLYRDLTAAENLRFWSRLTGLGRNAPVEDVLERVGLQDESDQRVEMLSHGMRQRLALGRVFLRRPALLLLDEPYAALDETGKELVEELIGEAAAEGRTVILTSHDVERAGNLASRVVEIARGRIVGDSSSLPDRQEGESLVRS